MFSIFSETIANDYINNRDKMLNKAIFNDSNLSRFISLELYHKQSIRRPEDETT